MPPEPIQPLPMTKPKKTAPFEGSKNQPANRTPSVPYPTKQMQKPVQPQTPPLQPQLTELLPTPQAAPRAQEPAPSQVSPAQAPRDLAEDAVWMTEARTYADILVQNAAKIRYAMSPYACSVAVRSMTETNSRCLPPFGNWLVGRAFDFPFLVWTLIQEPGWVEQHARAVAMMLADNTPNLQWAGSVLMGMAVYEAIARQAQHI